MVYLHIHNWKVWDEQRIVVLATTWELERYHKGLSLLGEYYNHA